MLRDRTRGNSSIGYCLLNDVRQARQKQRALRQGDWMTFNHLDLFESRTDRGDQALTNPEDCFGNDVNDWGVNECVQCRQDTSRNSILDGKNASVCFAT
jgi:hypothetical protein